MKANPDKFHAICICRKTHDAISSFQINDTIIKCDDNVTLLGVNIDFKCFYDDALTELVNHYANRILIVSCTKDNTYEVHSESSRTVLIS